MIQIKRNLILSLEKRKKEGKLITKDVPIRLRVIYNGARVDLFTGYRVDIDKWDNDKEQVKNSFTNRNGESSSKLNSIILNQKLTIQELFIVCESQDRIPTKEEIKDTFKRLKSKGKSIDNSLLSKDDFFSVFDKFVKVSGRMNNWSVSTYAKFSTVKKHLTTFNKDLSFENLNQETLTNYLVFLREVKNMRNSTIKKQIDFLKWFLRWSFENNLHNNDCYKAFKPKIKISDKTIIFLTEDDKKKLLEYEIPESKEYLKRVRDILFFTCYSGLRYSDVFNLKRSDLKNTHFEITTIKTYDYLIIEFNKHSKAILKKYENIPYKNNKALPVISNQKMNDYLKELGELAEINELIKITYFIGNERKEGVFPKYELLSTHVGRRTFICTALSLNIPVQVIMKWTGHTDYKAMKPYIDIEDKTRQNAMSKFDMI